MNAVKNTSSRGNSRNPQPLHVLQLQDALLRIGTVAQATGLSAATIYRKVAAGELPIVKMGARCTRFRAADVRAFIARQGRSPSCSPTEAGAMHRATGEVSA
ncbi:helix-turn-helix transcriptional regulator [Roseateles toxinivorans]|uniref:helix-turn-helix transcriptional regulator n=1 Tax=Roseateles toxinivorans TaxID=270368 RepID=UPI00105EAC40|nr:helix-turn-helix domain-containing protein [Roseateles toxinivorans]